MVEATPPGPGSGSNTIQVGTLVGKEAVWNDARYEPIGDGAVRCR